MLYGCAKCRYLRSGCGTCRWVAAGRRRAWPALDVSVERCGRRCGRVRPRAACARAQHAGRRPAEPRVPPTPRLAAAAGRASRHSRGPASAGSPTRATTRRVRAGPGAAALACSREDARCVSALCFCDPASPRLQLASPSHQFPCLRPPPTPRPPSFAPLAPSHHSAPSPPLPPPPTQASRPRPCSAPPWPSLQTLWSTLTGSSRRRVLLFSVLRFSSWGLLFPWAASPSHRAVVEQ